MSPFKPGDVILGKYEVTRLLGEGGMGVVLAARHLELNELVALKFLLPALQANTDVAARFAREARTGIRIKNEHVVRMFDVGTLPDGAAFMVMEYLDGEDMASMLARRGALPPAEAVDLLLQACEAVAEAHALGIVHRDLKPANLFVTTGSDGLPFVKVLDFGISKTVNLENASVTGTGAVLGSPLYMSPEQLAASRDVDARSDIWSLGVILYEMVAGKTPFNGTSFPTICAAILGGQYARASTLRPSLPGPIDDVIRDALALDRAARIGTVAELAQRIAAFGSETAVASSARIRRIAGRFSSAAPPGAVRAAPTAFDPTVPLLGDSADRRPSESPAAASPGTAAGLARSSPSAGAAARSSRAPVVAALGVLLAAAVGVATWRWTAAPSSARPAAPPEATPATASPAPLPHPATDVAPSAAAATPPLSSATSDAAVATTPLAPSATSSAQRQDSKGSHPAAPARAPAAARPATSVDLFGSQK
jgi:serine/threonine-protein kinase